MYTMQLAVAIGFGLRILNVPVYLVQCRTAQVAPGTYQQYVQVCLQGVAFCEVCLVADAISHNRN